MTYLSDRKRREYVYITRVIQLTACHAVDTDEQTQQNIRTLCQQALDELLPYEQEKQRQLWRRINCAIDVTLKLMVQKDPNIAGERAVLIVYYLLDKLAETGALLLVHDSPLHKIVEWLLSNIDPENELTQHRMIKAEKEAQKWIERLQKEGFFNQ
jgi:hypothetical protein